MCEHCQGQGHIITRHWCGLLLTNLLLLQMQCPFRQCCQHIQPLYKKHWHQTVFITTATGVSLSWSQHSSTLELFRLLMVQPECHMETSVELFMRNIQVLWPRVMCHGYAVMCSFHCVLNCLNKLSQMYTAIHSWY